MKTQRYNVRFHCQYESAAVLTVSDLEQYTPLHQRNFMRAVEIINCTEVSSPFPHFSQKFQIKPWVLNYGRAAIAVEEFKVLSSCCTKSRDMKKVEKTFNAQKCGLFSDHFVIMLNFTMLQKFHCQKLNLRQLDPFLQDSVERLALSQNQTLAAGSISKYVHVIYDNDFS